MWRWEFAILEVLNSLKGQASLPQLYQALEDRYPLQDKDLRPTVYSGRPAYQHQARSRISNLCQTGHLIKTGRGCYALTTQGKQRFLNELAQYAPEAPALKYRKVVVPVEVTQLEDGRYLAVCEAIQGCHAEGDTVAEALDILEDVARLLIEIGREDGLPDPSGLEELRPDSILRAQVVVPLSE